MLLVQTPPTPQGEIDFKGSISARSLRGEAAQACALRRWGKESHSSMMSPQPAILRLRLAVSFPSSLELLACVCTANSPRCGRPLGDRRSRLSTVTLVHPEHPLQSLLLHQPLSPADHRCPQEIIVPGVTPGPRMRTRLACLSRTPVPPVTPDSCL